MKVALSLLIVFAGFSVPAQAHPGGGWDLNNVKISVTGSRLLTQNSPYPLGGWDGNNVRVSVVEESKLLPAAPQDK